MGDADEYTLMMTEPAAKRQKRSTRQVGDRTIDEQDYNNVLPLVQMVHDGVSNDRLYGRPPPTLQDVFDDTVVVSAEKNHRVTKIASFWNYIVAPTTTLLPESIAALDALENLSLRSGPRISHLPNYVCQLPCLKELQVSSIRYLSVVPSTIGSLQKLSVLKLTSLDSVSELPEELGSMTNLKTLDLRDNKALTRLPTSLPANLVNLQTTGSPIRELNESIGNLQSLESLSVEFANLSSLPRSFKNLKSLKDLDTGTMRPFNFILNFVNHPSLQDVRTNIGSIGNFLSSALFRGKLFVSGRRFHADDVNTMLDGVLRLRDWPNLSGFDSYLIVNADYDGHVQFPLDHVFRDTFASLLQLKKVILLFSDYRDRLSRTKSKVFLTEFARLVSLEDLSLYGALILTDGVTLQSPCRLSLLKTLTLFDCEIDFLSLHDLLLLPNLVHLSIDNIKKGAHTLTDKIFEHLCTAWFVHMPRLQILSLTMGEIATISAASIAALATLDLREVCFHDQKIFRGDKKDIERQIVPLLKACKHLAWGFEKADSPKIDFLTQANELRFKLLGGQRIPPSLWPLLFEHASIASKYHQSSKDAMAQPNAIYLLLRQRAVSELFESGNHSD